MKKIEFITTQELFRLEREFENPQNLTESIMLRGIRAELVDRERARFALPPLSGEVIAELEDEVESLEERLEAERGANAEAAVTSDTVQERVQSVMLKAA